jgi:hypothetical protein
MATKLEQAVRDAIPDRWKGYVNAQDVARLITGTYPRLLGGDIPTLVTRLLEFPTANTFNTSDYINSFCGNGRVVQTLRETNVRDGFPAFSAALDEINQVLAAISRRDSLSEKDDNTLRELRNQRNALIRAIAKALSPKEYRLGVHRTDFFDQAPDKLRHIGELWDQHVHAGNDGVEGHEAQEEMGVQQHNGPQDRTLEQQMESAFASLPQQLREGITHQMLMEKSWYGATIYDTLRSRAIDLMRQK